MLDGEEEGCGQVESGGVNTKVELYLLPLSTLRYESWRRPWGAP